MPTIDGATLGTVWMALAAALLIFVWWLSLRRVLPRMTPKRRNRMLLWTYAVPLLAGPLLPLADDAGHPGKRFMLKLLLLLAWVLLIAIVYNITYKNKPNMRKKIVAGNWKMNTLPAEGVELAKGVVAGRGEVCRCVDFIVCPPFTHLSMVAEALKGSDIALGAQDCAAEAKGAYTGEVAASMIAALGCKYVILGHSERRQYYGETSATLNKKMEQAYANNLTPIYCVGENLDEREAGKHFDVVKQQIEEVVYNLSAEQFKNLVIAYEPVWAIGTGKTATADQAQEIHAHIRKVLAAKFGAAADECAILYGGSCKPSNAAEIFAKEDVDGGLIGGAALKADDFLAIGKGFEK
jgi:triosephosphate isomerase